MKIYVAHSNSFDYKKELYEPIRKSDINNKYEIILPHEVTTEQFNSKRVLKKCNLVIAEVSYPSTGQGIELGWANMYDVPIVCYYKKGTKPSGALKVVSDEIFQYDSPKDLIQQINKYISKIKKS